MYTILLAEDEPPLRLALYDKLTESGFAVIAAANGQQAIDQLAKTKKPDIVLLDLMMPIKDGFAVLDQMKSQPETKDIPVLVLTNFGHGDIEKKVFAAGGIDYTVKTDISLKEIVAKVKKILHNKPKP